jgi:hypothetical protein
MRFHAQLSRYRIAQPRNPRPAPDLWQKMKRAARPPATLLLFYSFTLFDLYASPRTLR